MLECEAVCTRIGMMKNGNMGTPSILPNTRKSPKNTCFKKSKFPRSFNCTSTFSLTFHCPLLFTLTVCLGDSQRLRTAHGTGFLLEIALADTSFMHSAMQFVSATFRNTVVVDQHGTMVNYEVPRESIRKLSEAFSIMEKNKTQLGIIDYSLSQSTLEQA